MADVRPFKGLRFNTRVVGNLSDVICPPFDTISPELQNRLYQRGEYNVVRLESGERLPTDTDEENRYTRAAGLLDKWIEEQVLVRDSEPAFYLIEHGFALGGEKRSRVELMACVRLEEYENRVVLPHEYTRDADKRDRLALIEACRSNFSPIMCLYRDEEKRLSPIFQSAMAESPVFHFSDAGDQKYRVWRITGTEHVKEIRDVISSRSLYIADGHHRYETALAFRDLHRNCQSEDEAINFVMMGLIAFDDPGLLVLPYHNVVGGLSPDQMRQVLDKLDEFFTDREFHHRGKRDVVGLVREVELRGSDRLAMGMMGPDEDSLRLFVQRDGLEFADEDLMGRSEAWVLFDRILKPVLGDSVGQHLDYAHEPEEVERKVRSGECQLGFLMKPFPLDLFEAVMDAGRRLPPKSTFFYPKLATGLVINRLDGTL